MRQNIGSEQIKSFLSIIDRFVHVVSLIAAIVAAGILLTIFVIVQYEVIMRYVFNSPTYWTNEVSAFAIAWVGLLSAGYVLRLGKQLEIDIVFMRVSSRAGVWLGTCTDILAAFFTGLVAYLAYNFVVTSWLMRASSASELDTPLWIPYLAVPIGFAILTLELILRAVSRWGLIRGREARRSDSYDEMGV